MDLGQPVGLFRLLFVSFLVLLLWVLVFEVLLLAFDDFGHHFGFAPRGPTFDFVGLFAHDGWKR